jgi:hypothetical protein
MGTAGVAAAVIRQDDPAHARNVGEKSRPSVATILPFPVFEPQVNRYPGSGKRRGFIS